MDIILHAGAHCTDEDRLLKALLRNSDLLRSVGTSVPGPSRYRVMLGEIVAALGTGAPAPDARDILMDSLLDMPESATRRLFLSQPNLFSVPRLILDDGQIYRKAEERLTRLCQVFDGDRVTLFLAVRNWASLVSALIDATPHSRPDDILGLVDPLTLYWSDFVMRLRKALPDLAITLWCYEDTPLTWGQIVRAAGGLPPGQKILGAFDVFADIVSEEGMRRFRAFLRDNPDVSEEQKRRAMTAILEHYALPDAVEEELDLPDWTEDMVAALTEAYDDDIALLAGIDGVSVIRP